MIPTPYFKGTLLFIPMHGPLPSFRGLPLTLVTYTRVTYQNFQRHGAPRGLSARTGLLVTYCYSFVTDAAVSWHAAILELNFHFFVLNNSHMMVHCSKYVMHCSHNQLQTCSHHTEQSNCMN